MLFDGTYFRYMISFCPTPDVADEPHAVIWELFTGQKKRSFHCDNAASWPIFKWNHNGKYFARLTTDTLSVYETPVSEAPHVSAIIHTRYTLIMIF